MKKIFGFWSKEPPKTDSPKLTKEELKKRQVEKVDREMKRKLNKDSKYQLKFVIRGSRGSGKTNLFNRLKGKKFVKELNPTEGMRTAKIHWNYKASDDTVIIEIWDIGDNKHSKIKNMIKRKKKGGGLKISHDQDISSGDEDFDSEAEYGGPELPIDTDAQILEKMKNVQTKGGVTEGSHTMVNVNLIDVYKNCNAVLFLYDVRHKSSFYYIKKEIKAVPKGTPILLLGNFYDLVMKENAPHRVSDDMVNDFIERYENEYTIKHIHTSMSNCFGLKEVHTAFQLPFLKYKIDSVKNQLSLLEKEYSMSEQEIDLNIELNTWENHEKNVKANRPTKDSPVSSIFSEEKNNMDRLHTPSSPETPTPNGDFSPTEEKVEKKTQSSTKKPSTKEEKPAKKAAPREKAPPKRRASNKPHQKIKSIDEFVMEDEEEEDFDNFYSDDSDSDTYAETNITSSRTIPNDEDDTDSDFEKPAELAVPKRHSRRSKRKSGDLSSIASPKNKSQLKTSTHNDSSLSLDEQPQLEVTPSEEVKKAAEEKRARKEAARLKAEAQEAARLKAEELAKAKAAEAARLLKEEEAKRKREEAIKKKAEEALTSFKVSDVIDEEDTSGFWGEDDGEDHDSDDEEEPAKAIPDEPAEDKPMTDKDEVANDDDDEEEEEEEVKDLDQLEESPMIHVEEDEEDYNFSDDDDEEEVKANSKKPSASKPANDDMMAALQAVQAQMAQRLEAPVVAPEKEKPSSETQSAEGDKKKRRRRRRKEEDGEDGKRRHRSKDGKRRRHRSKDGKHRRRRPKEEDGEDATTPKKSPVPKDEVEGSGFVEFN